MKKTIMTMMTLVSVSAFAYPELDLGARAEACLSTVDKAYVLSKSESKQISLNPVSFDKVLFANQKNEIGVNNEVSYETDKLLYKATGSEHSGWFEDAIIVDVLTCKISEIINVYSE